MSIKKINLGVVNINMINYVDFYFKTKDKDRHNSPLNQFLPLTTHQIQRLLPDDNVNHSFWSQLVAFKHFLHHETF
jgi:hypothetical protein